MPNSFHMKRQVQFAETDMAGILHFANYYRIMEEVEHAFWRSHGRSVLTPETDGHISWPRVTTECEYVAPVRFEDVLDITLAIARVSEKSVTYVVTFQCRDETIAKGRVTAVCCRMDRNGFTPIRIPDDLRSVLE